jgi:pSer/pThr/pTyr-binding forkhead associated (FHA) protein
MLQLQILSGQQAGALWSARRFPVRVGRAPGNDLQLTEAGVWDQHFELAVNPQEGFILTAQPEAIVTVNHEPVRIARLRNGDSIEIGAARLCFRLGETRQQGLWPREWFVWTLVTFVSLGEITLVYWLLR